MTNTADHPHRICVECGISWDYPNPDCPKRVFDAHPYSVTRIEASMNTVTLTALIIAIGGLLGTITALIAQIQHNKNPNAHK